MIRPLNLQTFIFFPPDALPCFISERSAGSYWKQVCELQFKYTRHILQARGGNVTAAELTRVVGKQKYSWSVCLILRKHYSMDAGKVTNREMGRSPQSMTNSVWDPAGAFLAV